MVTKVEMKCSTHFSNFLHQSNKKLISQEIHNRREKSFAEVLKDVKSKYNKE